MNDLSKIQSEIKAPKGQFNKFGNYKYRSCEDIVEAAKPVLNKYGYSLVLTDEVVNIGSRFYVKATATISRMPSEIAIAPETYTASAWAREDETIKGMAGAQITGSASSYARKYALNGLFAIDDTKDADATNTHGKEPNFDDVPDENERKFLRDLCHKSDLTDDEKAQTLEAIDTLKTYEKYQYIQNHLEDRQQPFDTITNPNGSDINKQVRKISKQPA